MHINYLIPILLSILLPIRNVCAAGTILPGPIDPTKDIEVKCEDYLALVHVNMQKYSS